MEDRSWEQNSASLCVQAEDAEGREDQVPALVSIEKNGRNEEWNMEARQNSLSRVENSGG